MGAEQSNGLNESVSTKLPDLKNDLMKKIEEIYIKKGFDLSTPEGKKAAIDSLGEDADKIFPLIKQCIECGELSKGPSPDMTKELRKFLKELSKGDDMGYPKSIGRPYQSEYTSKEPETYVSTDGEIIYIVGGDLENVSFTDLANFLNMNKDLEVTPRGLAGILKNNPDYISSGEPISERFKKFLDTAK